MVEKSRYWFYHRRCTEAENGWYSIAVVGLNGTSNVDDGIETENMIVIVMQEVNDVMYGYVYGYVYMYARQMSIACCIWGS